MKKRSPFRIFVEVSLLIIIIAVINFFFRDNPGFLKLPVNPYFIVALIAAVYYGRIAGIVSLFVSVLLVSGVFPFVEILMYSKTAQPGYWGYLFQEAMLGLSITLAGTYLFGMIRDGLAEENAKKDALLGQIGREQEKMKREVAALKTVNRELEQRVYTHKDSTIALYMRIQEIYSFNLEKSLNAILDIVQNLTDASQCSIWEYNTAGKSLELRHNFGWDSSAAQQTRIPVENTIEGWVLRNNLMFSATMLVQYENLARMDSGRNIYTVPIRAGRKVWGILNIEELPFEKFNLHTEEYIRMMMELVAPALEKSLEYESFSVQDNINPVTRFPPFSQFFVYMEQELIRESIEQGTLSVIIIELKDYENHAELYGKEGVFEFYLKLSEKIQEILPMHTLFFHYKSDSQIVFSVSKLDFDGCSLVCLNIMEMVNNVKWELKEKEMQPELIFGYASYSNTTQGPDDILKLAENLLEMQKV